MPGYNVTFIRMLIRQARVQSAEPHDCAAQIAWLEAQQAALFPKIQNGDQALQSSSMNGKSIAFVVTQGTTQTEAAKAYEKAIEWVQAGLFPTTEVRAAFGFDEAHRWHGASPPC